MEGKVIPDGKNGVSKVGKHEGIPEKWKEPNVADLKRCP